MPPKAQRRSDITGQYLAVRRMTEELVADISPEDAMLQSMPEASPVKWHLAHTTWFFETFVLTPHMRGYKTVNPAFRNLFNSYYNAVGAQPQRDRRGLFSRPSFAQVMDYRAHVDKAMLKLLDGSREVHALATLGLNHEQQHQELIVTDFKHALWTSPLRPAWRRALRADNGTEKAQKPRWISVTQPVTKIGHDGNGFCFDNELPRHEVVLQPFAIASRLVTNSEYLDFIEDGGYQKPELWLSDGWKTVQEQGWRAPLYWEQSDEEWRHFTVSGMRDIADDLDKPVAHVSYYEADAYARWAGARLPTEFEWEAAVGKSETTGSFIESGALEPRATPGDQFFGECWQWTASAYLPYPGYKPAEGALGEYNGKFMINQMVLRGASCATPRSHARVTYRNFFSPASRWQFSGIRLAR